MDVDLQALTDHAKRIANIIMWVQQELLRKHLQPDTILRKRNVSRCIHGVVNVLAVNVTGTMPQSNSATAVHSANVAGGGAHHDTPPGAPRPPPPPLLP